MKPIEGIDLISLANETVNDVLAEKRASVAGLVKELLQKSEQLAKEVVKAESELAKKRQQLTAVNEKIQKLRAGDWSVLAEKDAPKQE